MSVNHQRLGWFDRVAVERGLDAWLVGMPFDRAAGRRYSAAERRVIVRALVEVGASQSEVCRGLHIGWQRFQELRRLPENWGHAQAARQRTAAAVAYLYRCGAQRLSELQPPSLTRTECERIAASSIAIPR